MPAVQTPAFALIFSVPVIWTLLFFSIPVILTLFPQQQLTFNKHSVTDMVQVGPWGGNGGLIPWKFVPEGRICKIHIRSGGCVDSIDFNYKDHAGVEHDSETYGGDGGLPQTIIFADDENLIGISGTVGVFHSHTVITSLSFQTNKKTYGPSGTDHGTSFSLPVTKGGFAGFSGNHGDYLDSLRVILRPY